MCLSYASLGHTKKWNTKIIQTFKNKVLCSIVDPLRYLRNDDIHRDLKIPMVTDKIKQFIAICEDKLHKHENNEILQLLDNAGLVW